MKKVENCHRDSSRLNQAEERTCELEDNSFEIIQSEEEKKNESEENWHELRDVIKKTT